MLSSLQLSRGLGMMAVFGCTYFAGAQTLETPGRLAEALLHCTKQLRHN